MIWWHKWVLRHKMYVNRTITIPLFDSGARGDLYKCSCGKMWAR